jgi:calcium load-activated calcium channel
MADVTNAILIVIFTILLSLFTEFVNFILVYRLPEYKKNVSDIEKENEALEQLQNKLDAASLNQREKIKKSIKKSKAKIKDYNQKMFGIKFKSTLVMILTTVAVFAVLSSTYEGEVLLKLPFEPISFIRGMSHRGIDNDNFYDCSFLFIYILGNMSLRPMISKLLGTEPPKGAKTNSIFQMPDLDEDE